MRRPSFLTWIHKNTKCFNWGKSYNFFISHSLGLKICNIVRGCWYRLKLSTFSYRCGIFPSVIELIEHNWSTSPCNGGVGCSNSEISIGKFIENTFFICLKVIQFNSEALKCFILRGFGVLSEFPRCFDTSGSCGSIVSEGIVVSESHPLLPWESLIFVLQSSSEGRANEEHTMLVKSHIFIIMK